MFGQLAGGTAEVSCSGAVKIRRGLTSIQACLVKFELCRLARKCS